MEVYFHSSLPSMTDVAKKYGFQMSGNNSIN